MITPVHSFVRRGFSIYMIDMARNRHHYCDCANTDIAEELAQILANLHGVEVAVEPTMGKASDSD